jgi:hypothetical protein
MSKRRKDPAAVSLGRRGGKIGGRAKVPKGLAKMTPERRSEIARLGARSRWKRESGEDKLAQ